MKKHLIALWGLAALLSFSSRAADAPRLLARLPSVDKLPANCEIILRADVQRLQGVPFIARARAAAPGPTALSSKASGLLGGLGSSFKGRGLDDIQEILFFQIDASADSKKKSPLAGAYLRGTFRRTEILKTLQKAPAGKIEGLELYEVDSSEKLAIPSRFVFLAENVVLIGEVPFIRTALGALHGTAPALPANSSIAKIFQNDQSYMLGLAKSDALSLRQEGSPVAGQASALGLGGLVDEPPSAYLFSLAPVAGKASVLRASLDLVFQSEQTMLRARDNLNGLLAFLVIGAQENPALQAFQERLKVSGLHKRVRIALEIDEKLLALATEQMATSGPGLDGEGDGQPAVPVRP